MLSSLKSERGWMEKIQRFRKLIIHLQVLELLVQINVIMPANALDFLIFTWNIGRLFILTKRRENMRWANE